MDLGAAHYGLHDETARAPGAMAGGLCEAAPRAQNLGVFLILRLFGTVRRCSGRNRPVLISLWEAAEISDWFQAPIGRRSGSARMTRETPRSP